jgi:hypothetical protein
MSIYRVTGIIEDPHGSRCTCVDCYDSDWKRAIDRTISAPSPDVAIEWVSNLLHAEAYWNTDPSVELAED